MTEAQLETVSTLLKLNGSDPLQQVQWLNIFVFLIIHINFHVADHCMLSSKSHVIILLLSFYVTHLTPPTSQPLGLNFISFIFWQLPKVSGVQIMLSQSFLIGAGP